jgi:hypothetical protein
MWISTYKINQWQATGSQPDFLALAVEAAKAARSGKLSVTSTF